MPVSTVIVAVIIIIILVLVDYFRAPRVPKYSNALHENVCSLVDQSIAWNRLALSRASEPNEAHRLVYVSRAMAYLSVARRFMPDVDIERSTSVDIAALVNKLESTEGSLMFSVDGSTEAVPGWLQHRRSIS